MQYSIKVNPEIEDKLKEYINPKYAALNKWQFLLQKLSYFLDTKAIVMITTSNLIR